MASNKSSYKKNNPLETRKAESLRYRIKRPDRVPVIVEKNAKSTDIPDIEKLKHLVPGDLTVGKFVCKIRKKIKIEREKAFFIFVNNTMPPQAALMFSVYEQNKDEDGFLYVTYSGENVFG